MSLIIGCGKNSEPQASAESARTLQESLERYDKEHSSQWAREVIFSTSTPNLDYYIRKVLDKRYGSNPNVTKVIVGGGGTDGVFSAGAGYGVFVKSGKKFNKVSGEAAGTFLYPYAAVYFYPLIPLGYFPIAAGAAGFCAGKSGQGHETGIAAFSMVLSGANASWVGGLVIKNPYGILSCGTAASCVPIATFPYRPLKDCDRLLSQY